MDKALRIVMPNSSLIISSAARNLSILLRAGSVRNLVLSGKDYLVGSLLAMTFIKESLNISRIFS
jgi:hypothetical protein